jgi:hypothetical protein
MAIGFHEINLEETPVGKIVTLRFKEKLSKEDYDEFIPRIESIIDNSAKIRLLVELHDLKGWTAGSLWEDTKFAARHFNDIELMAIVGDKRWEKGVTVFIKPFTKAKVRYFEMDEVEKARQWVYGAS